MWADGDIPMKRKRGRQSLPLQSSTTGDGPMTSARSAPRPGAWIDPRWWGGMLGLLVLVVCVYWPTLGNGFIWDDETYVENNVSLQSAAGLYDIWFKLGAVPQYYPLVHTTFWIENHLWGLNPRGYHLANLALHAAAAMLLWRVLVQLQVPGAWLAAAIFAVHPVHVETVAWVTERKNVLSCLLGLGSIWAYLKFSPPEPSTLPDEDRTSGRWWYFSLALLLYVLALFSKTVACSVPAVLLVIYWWKRGRLDGREAVRLAPFFAIGLTLASLTVWMEKVRVLAVGDEWDFSPLDRMLIAGRALWFYASKLAWPNPLIFFYPRWTIDDTQWWQYLYPVAAAVVLILLGGLRHRIGRGPLAAVLIFAGVLLPALGFFNVYPFRFSFVADHFQYHASIALIALAAAGIAWGAGRLNLRWGLPLAAIVILFPLAILAHQRTYVYRGLESLYEDTIAQNPTCWNAHHNLGIVLEGKADYEAAIMHHRAAVQLDPKQPRSRISLATALISTKRWDEAGEQLTAALSTQTDNYDRSHALAYLGAVRMAQQRHDEGFAAYREALQIMPQNWTALSLLAPAQWSLGDKDAAIQTLREALRLKPQDAERQHQLGKMLLSRARSREAIEPLAYAVQLAPDRAHYQTDLGTALFQTGNLEHAERSIRVAVELDPTSADAHNILGAIFGSHNKLPAAIAEFQTALQLNPRHPDARNNLQNALEAQRRSPSK